ncbi:Omega-amidase nit3 [Hypoxylon texense]
MAKRSTLDSTDLLTSTAGGSQEAEMTALPRPYKPDDDERDLYYFGIAGTPKLVARTGHDRWAKQEEEVSWDSIRQIPKRYVTIGKGDIASKWTRDVSVKIAEALGGYSWTYFFPIRIDLQRTHTTASRAAFPVVLLIAVEEDSLQWEEGIIIALKCREILQESHITHVEVEIREGRYERDAASRQLEAQIDGEEWERGRTNELVSPMISYSGYALGYHDDIKGQGTVGLHLRLEGKDSAVYGLTCRHVVCNGRAPNESYNVSAESNRQYHVQANTTGFDDCLQSLTEYQESLDSALTPLKEKHTRWEEWYSTAPEEWDHKRPTQEDTRRLHVIGSAARYNRKIIESLKMIGKKDDRKIGDLAFHPNFQLSTRRPGYLKDWALVELDEEKFLHGPENKVFIGDGKTYASEHVPKEPMDFIRDEQLDNGFLPLRLTKLDDEDMNASFRVGKRGSTSNLTFGAKSAIEAVVRQPGCGAGDFYCWEMLIVPFPRHSSGFSRKGDSGACVFDFQGRVVGLLTGSSKVKSDTGRPWRGIPTIKGDSAKEQRLKKYPGKDILPETAAETAGMESWPEETDVSFATPIQWVLDDIEDFTGLRARLA